MFFFEESEFCPFAHFSTNACNSWISEAMVQKCHSRQRELSPLHISVPLRRVDNPALYWCAQWLPLHLVVLQALCGHASVVEYLLQLNAAPDLAGLVLQSYEALWCPAKLAVTVLPDVHVHLPQGVYNYRAFPSSKFHLAHPLGPSNFKSFNSMFCPSRAGVMLITPVSCSSVVTSWVRDFKELHPWFAALALVKNPDGTIITFWFRSSNHVRYLSCNCTSSTLPTISSFLVVRLHIAASSSLHISKLLLLGSSSMKNLERSGTLPTFNVVSIAGVPN